MFYNIFGGNMNDDKVIFHIDVNNAFLSWTAVKLLEQGYDGADPSAAWV